MILLHLGRVIGILGLLSGVIPLVISIARSETPMAWLSVAWMAAGLGVAIACDRTLVTRRQQQVKAGKKRGREFSGVQLTVRFRWFRWVWLLAVMFAVATSSLWIAQIFWQKGDLVGAMLGLCGVLLCTLLAGSMVWTAICALRSEGLLHVDKQGVHLAGIGLLAWSGIRGLDVHEEVFGRGARRYIMRLAIDTDIVAAASLPSGWRPWRWSQPRLLETGKVVEVPTLLLADNLEFLGESMRVLGVRFGPRFLANWNDSPLRNMGDFEREAEMFRKHEEMMQSVASFRLRPSDLLKMSPEEQARALRELTESTERLSASLSRGRE